MIRPQDLRLRIIGSVLALFIFSSISHLLPAAIGVIAVLLLFAINRQPIAFKRLLHLEGFLVLLLITLPFTIAGTEIFTLFGLSASLQGFMRALELACKVTASVLLVMFMFATTDPINIGMALRDLGLPNKLVHLFITVLRYFSLIQNEFSRQREAIRVRAFVPRSNMHTWRTYGYLIGMLLVRAIDRAERIEEAMRMRCYAGVFPQAEPTKPGLSDWLACIALLSITLLLLLVDKLWLTA